MDKYKIGDKLPLDMEIVDVEVDTEDEEEVVYLKLRCITLVSEHDSKVELDEWVTAEALAQATDPHYKERKRLAKIAELEEQLEQLKGEE